MVLQRNRGSLLNRQNAMRTNQVIPSRSPGELCLECRGILIGRRLSFADHKLRISAWVKKQTCWKEGSKYMVSTWANVFLVRTLPGLVGLQADPKSVINRSRRIMAFFKDTSPLFLFHSWKSAAFWKKSNSRHFGQLYSVLPQYQGVSRPVLWGKSRKGLFIPQAIDLRYSSNFICEELNEYSRSLPLHWL